MFDKLIEIENKYRDTEASLASAEVIADPVRLKEAMKELKRLAPVVEKFREYKEWKNRLAEAEELLSESDPEIKKLAQEELSESKDALRRCEEELTGLLLSKDPNDDKNVIIEIRGGAGGEEAALFAGSLYRMYSMYAAAHKYKTEIISSNPTELGGFKEISFSVEGEGVYSRFKY